jgi:hypothetical protein
VAMTSVESCLRRSAEFPVAALRSQNRTSEHGHSGGEVFVAAPETIYSIGSSALVTLGMPFTLLAIRTLRTR